MSPETTVRSAMSIRALLDWAARTLEGEHLDTPRLDAEVILAAVLDQSRTWLFTWSDTRVPDEAMQRYCESIRRRARREPVAYIAGRREFFNLDLRVTRDVLIPRPETEVLVAAALTWLSDRKQPRILDLGTGSGAIALAVARNCAGCKVVATDVSPAALEVARENAARLRLAQRVSFRRGDLWDAVAADERFDLILSNPPYVSDDEFARLQPNVRDYEPRVALAAAGDGLAVLRRIVDGAGAHLAPDAALGMEIGAGQGATAAELLEAASFREVRVLRDLAGMDRIAWGEMGTDSRGSSSSHMPLASRGVGSSPRRPAETTARPRTKTPGRKP